MESLNSEETVMCVVCRDDIQEDSVTTITTTCGHLFHYGCFVMALQSSSVCPLCRASLYPDGTSPTETREEGEVDGISGTRIVEISLETLGPETLDIIRTQLNATLETEGQTDFIEGSDLELRRAEFNLFTSCEAGDFESVRSTLSERRNMMYSEDDENNTLVHSAVFSLHEGLMRYLVCDLNLDVNVHNIYRMTPVHIASSCSAHVHDEDSSE